MSKYSKFSYNDFVELNKSKTERFDIDRQQTKRLESLQGSYRTKMGKLETFQKDTLTNDERAERDSLLEAVREVVREIDKFPTVRESESGTVYFSGGHTRKRRPYSIRTAQDDKSYRSMFGDESGYEWQDSETDFYRAVFSGRHHPELTQRSLQIGTPSDGGFLLPSEQTAEIHAISLENELILPRCTTIPMLQNERILPAMEIGNHSSNVYGGFTASYKAEEASLSEANPKARAMKLSCKKLTGYLKFSNELLEDLGDGGQGITDICGKGLAWYRDIAFLTGSGAGEPLGILNSGCLVSVEKESGQSENTITYNNLTSMMSRMFAGSFKNSVWIAHQTTIPQLLQLSIAIGTGGSFIPVMTKGPAGGFEILTRPVIFTEKTEVLGDKGDIILADLSQYVVGLRSDLRLDFSPHVFFATDQTAARLISRHDGMPLWDEALTLKDGSSSVSPFVTLNARA